MEISFPVPTFKKYNFSPLSEIEKESFSGSHFSREKSAADARSSTCKNSLKTFPEPQQVIDDKHCSFAKLSN